MLGTFVLGQNAPQHGQLDEESSQGSDSVRQAMGRGSGCRIHRMVRCCFRVAGCAVRTTAEAPELKHAKPHLPRVRYLFFSTVLFRRLCSLEIDPVRSQLTYAILHRIRCFPGLFGSAHIDQVFCHPAQPSEIRTPLPCVDERYVDFTLY
jgi:hypothetical protein